MKRPLLGLLLGLSSLLLSAAAGCGGGGSRAALRIQLAPSPNCARETADYPPELRFVTVEICPSTGGDCAPLTTPGGDHNGGSPQLRVERQLGDTFTVDARLDASVDYDVRVVAYSGPATGTCAPSALGHVYGVRLGRDHVTVRMYPFDQWSCAGVHESATATSQVSRALHQAVLLPDHEVLILGGVQATASASSFQMPRGAAQTLVEVFDPRDATFHNVALTDEDGAARFSRALFQARYVRTDDQGRYEIHVTGGFDPQVTAEGGIGFDGTARINTASVMIGPMARAMTGQPTGFRPDATLVFDPATRTATMTADAGTGYTTAAATESPGVIGIVHGFRAVTLNAAGRPTYTFDSAWSTNDGHGGTLMASRVGASITPLSASAFLIWGGDATDATGNTLTLADAITHAGEVVTTGTPAMDTLVAGHDPTMAADADGIPFATAHHTATRIAGPSGSTAILFAGGINLAGGNAPLGGLGVATPALTVTRFAADGTIVGGTRLPGPISTIFHTVTPIDASSSELLLVGGASVQMSMGATASFFAESQVGRVTYDASTGYAWEAEPSLATARWGHTTTIIPEYGVLVVGGMSRTANDLNAATQDELYLWESLQGTAPTGTMGCGMADDAGMPRDAGTARDAGARDAGAAPDTGMAADDAGTDAG